MLSATSLDGADEVYDGAVTRVLQVADVLAGHGNDVHVHTGVDDPEAADDHPERDALLKLVDNWRNDALAEQEDPSAGELGKARAEQARHCADELLSTLARLSL